MIVFIRKRVIYCYNSNIDIRFVGPNNLQNIKQVKKGDNMNEEVYLFQLCRLNE